ncbi:MAG: hypothetical protein P8J50_14495 [Acidimicrobiales bacterium]|nr:hypothetical protein [Acidimicrobiales bacterium]
MKFAVLGVVAAVLLIGLLWSIPRIDRWLWGTVGLLFALVWGRFGASSLREPQSAI